MLIGLTPLVDNFMHMGGMIAGLVIGLALFAKKRVDDRTGVRARTSSQEAIVLLAVALGFVLAACAVAVLLSDALRDEFRACSLCSRVNCVPTSWWSCCLTASVGGSCYVADYDDAAVNVVCNMSGSQSFVAACSRISDPDGCRFVPNDWASTEQICQTLCFTGAC